jgi:hypothetical protein
MFDGPGVFRVSDDGPLRWCDAFDPVSCLHRSSRHRCSNFSNALSSTASFFNGERSTPGAIPATSQLDSPISITAISVAFCSRITRDLLKSFSWHGRSVDSLERRWCHRPRRSPHSIFSRRKFTVPIETGSTVDRDGFESESLPAGRRPDVADAARILPPDSRSNHAQPPGQRRRHPFSTPPRATTAIIDCPDAESCDIVEMLALTLLCLDPRQRTYAMEIRRAPWSDLSHSMRR